MIKGQKVRRGRIDSETVGAEMSTWQIAVLLAMAGCAIGCLLGIFRAIEKLVKGVLSVGAELTKINAKLESVEAVKGDDTSLEAIEAAVSGFEKLKRVDLTKAG